MEIKTTESLEIPVHQKLTLGTNKIHIAAIFVLCVPNLTISSNTRQDAIVVKNAKKMVPAKYDLKVINETIEAILQINQASGSLNNQPGGYPVSTLKCLENISDDGSLIKFSK